MAPRLADLAALLPPHGAQMAQWLLPAQVSVLHLWLEQLLWQQQARNLRRRRCVGQQACLQAYSLWAPLQHVDAPWPSGKWRCSACLSQSQSSPKTKGSNTADRQKS